MSFMHVIEEFLHLTQEPSPWFCINVAEWFIIIFTIDLMSFYREVTTGEVSAG